MNIVAKIINRLSVVPVRFWPQHLAALIEIRTLPNAACRSAYEQFMKKREGMDVTTNWLGRKSYFWFKHLVHLEDQPFDYLEVGSWEGTSACFVAHNFPKARIACVDSWMGAEDIKDVNNAENRFTENTKFFADRLTKMKGLSQQVLAALPPDKMYDVMYVDAAHYADDVMIDALLCWQRLKKNGIIIFDDFVWRFEGFAEHKWTNVAVKHFLELLSGEYRMLHLGHQVIIQRTVAREEQMRTA